MELRHVLHGSTRGGWLMRIVGYLVVVVLLSALAQTLLVLG